jgi:hypothetical protein
LQRTETVPQAEGKLTVAVVILLRNMAYMNAREKMGLSTVFVENANVLPRKKDAIAQKQEKRILSINVSTKESTTVKISNF